jgi:WD40 repeat protein
MVCNGELHVKDLSLPMLIFIQTGVPCKWTNDGQHFLLEHFDMICESPSQIYHSALPLCPSSSWIPKYYSAEPSQVVKLVKGFYTKWGTCTRTITFNETPQAISYSNKTIAVGFWCSCDNIIILNAITGSQTAVLSGHTNRVGALVFSSDGRLLVSGSDDKTVMLWDMQTGGVVKTFCGHAGAVFAVSISADCARIVSGSKDGRVLLWDVQTGECHQSIVLDGVVWCVGFSQANHKNIISICDSKFQQWDINGQQIGHTYDASHIAFSSDYTQFALCNENAVTVCNSDSGATIARFHLPDANVGRHCCFSPDGGLVAVASKNTAYVWNITNPVPHLVATFADHSDGITSLAFSSLSYLTSASHDKSVKFWQVGVSSTDEVAIDLKSAPSTSASIEFVSLQSKDEIVISADSNGVVNIWDISTGLCKKSIQTPARGRFWGDAQLIDGRLLFIWHFAGTIIFWEDKKHKIIHTVYSVSFGLGISGDGTKVFSVNSSGSVHRIHAWSLWTWEPAGTVEWETRYPYYLNSFHADGSKVWVQSGDLTPKGWDFGILGSPPIPLSNLSPDRPCFDFIHTVPCGGLSFVKNTVTGKEIFRLSGKHIKPYCVRWDGQYLVAGYYDGEVVILDFKHLYS